MLMRNTILHREGNVWLHVLKATMAMKTSCAKYAIQDALHVMFQQVIAPLATKQKPIPFSTTNTVSQLAQKVHSENLQLLSCVQLATSPAVHVKLQIRVLHVVPKHYPTS